MYKKESGCPYPIPLRNLQPNTEDRTKRVVQERRKLLLEDSVPIVIDESKSPAELTDLRYAIQGILVSYLWEYIKTRNVLKEKILQDEHFWSTFYSTFDESLDQTMENLIATGDRETKSPSSSHPTRFVQLYQSLQEFLRIEKRPEEYVYPSMAGLNHFGTHLFEALTKKYAQVTGAQMSEDEFKRFTENPKLKRLLMDWQTNTHYGLGMLHAHLAVNTRDRSTSSPFDTSHFNLNAEEATFEPDPTLFVSIANQFAFRDFPNEQRNCPMIYIGSFEEMWRWFIAIVSYQLYDTAYPQFSLDQPTNAASGAQAKIQSELKGLKLIAQ